MTMEVDTVQLFEFNSNITFEKALKEQLIVYKQTRYYSEKGRKWTINKDSSFINFGSNNCPIIRYEEDKIVYLSGGLEFKIFMITNSENKQSMVFFLEPEDNGIIRGGFGYPKEIIILNKKGVN